MTTVHISWFDSLRDNLVKPIDVEWNDLVDLLCGGHVELPEKALASMFNGARYVTPDELTRGMGYALSEVDGRAYTLRRQRSIKQVELLILDYDGTLSIADAKERFKRFEYVGYTSFSHLESPGIEKFRIVFPLAKPIPVQVASKGMGHCYGDLLGVIQEFAGLCDPVISNPNQTYYFPSAHPTRVEVAEAWHNRGEILDWRAWEPKASVSRDQSSATVSAGRNAPSTARQLDPDQVFEYKRGTIVARDVRSRIQGVRCPFHDDKAGTEFLNRFEDSKVIVFHCKRCGTYTLHPQETVERKGNSHEPRPPDQILPERIFSPQEQLLAFEPTRADGKEFVDAGNRQRVIEQLAQVKIFVK